MPKPILYVIIFIETIALVVFGVMLMQYSNQVAKTTTAIEPIDLSARAMTVYVKSAGKGDTATDVVGKVYIQDNATGRSEFLFDVGAGCFPTWTLDPQDGYHLLVSDDVDGNTQLLDTLMRDGALYYAFHTHSDIQIIRTMGIRATTLIYDDQTLRLNQQCS